MFPRVYGQPTSKNFVLGAQNLSSGGLGMRLHTHASQAHKFDYNFGPTLNGHNSLNINLNHAKFIF